MMRLSMQVLRARPPRPSCCASPSTMAVLPTPDSPISTGLFLVRRASTRIMRKISFSRPMTGSSRPSRARLGQVAAILFQRLVIFLGIAIIHVLAVAQFLDRVLDVLLGNVQVREQARQRRAGLLDHANDAEQDVLGRDELIMESVSLLPHQGGKVLDGGGHEDLRGHRGGRAATDLRLRLQDLIYPPLHELHVRTEQLEDVLDGPFRLLQQRQQHVVQVHLLVLVADKDFLRALDRLLGALGEAIKTHRSLLSWCVGVLPNTAPTGYSAISPLSIRLARYFVSSNIGKGNYNARLRQVKPVGT